MPALFPYPPLWETLANSPASSKSRPLLLPFPVGKGDGLPVENLAPATARGRRRNSVAPRLPPSPMRDKARMRVAATPRVPSALTSHFSQLTPRLPLRVFRATHPGLRKGLLWAPRLRRHPWSGFIRAALAVLLRLGPVRPEPGLLPPATPGHCARPGPARSPCSRHPHRFTSVPPPEKFALTVSLAGATPSGGRAGERAVPLYPPLAARCPSSVPAPRKPTLVRAPGQLAA